MSLELEVRAIKQELDKLEKKLKDLELMLKTRNSLSAFHRDPRTHIAVDDQLSSKKHANNRVEAPVNSRSNKTLRSRSFKVMRHLINVVDVSHLNLQQSLPPRLDPTCPTRLKSAESIGKLSRSNRKLHQDVPNARKPSSKQTPTTDSARISPRKTRKNSVQTHAKRSESTSTLHNDFSITNKLAESISQPSEKPYAYTIPSIFHSKRPRKDANTISHPVCNKTKVVRALSTPTPDKMSITDTVSLAKNIVSTPDQVQDLGNKVRETETTEPFKYTNLKMFAARVALLKYDPNLSDLLPTSKTNYQFIATSRTAKIKDLPEMSDQLRRKQIPGIWEWKEGTATARMYEYLKPEKDTLISNRRFKFVRWAWKGDVGQQPPRIKDLHDDISQSCQTLRWYWFNGVWLLYYFD